MLTVTILLQTEMPQSTLWTIILAFMVCLTLFTLYLRHDSEKHLKRGLAPKDEASDTVEEFVAMHGEPEAEFVLDVTRSNELDGVVLLYEKEIVVNGKVYERDKITDVTFNNAATPYTTSEYQLVLTTSMPDKPVIKAPMGMDAERARGIAADLAQQLTQE